MPSPNPNLKYERNLRGWSQGYLAKKIGVADYYISRWESGKYSPSPYYQQQLCEIFGKTAQELGFLAAPPPSDEKSVSIQITAIEPSGENAQDESPAAPIAQPLPERIQRKTVFSLQRILIILLCLLLLFGGGTIAFFVTQQQNAPHSNRNIYVNGKLESDLDFGVQTSGSQQGWLKPNGDAVTLTYPANQAWGTMFITVGPAVPTGQRPGIDLRGYRSLVVDLRAATDRQCVRIGIKDRNQPDDGTETSVPKCLTTQWSTITIPLKTFSRVDLSQVYVVFEVNFEGSSSMTVDVRNIRYLLT